MLDVGPFKTVLISNPTGTRRRRAEKLPVEQNCLWRTWEQDEESVQKRRDALFSTDSKKCNLWTVKGELLIVYISAHCVRILRYRADQYASNRSVCVADRANFHHLAQAISASTQSNLIGWQLSLELIPYRNIAGHVKNHLEITEWGKFFLSVPHPFFIQTS